jgi:hypothetical protein
VKFKSGLRPFTEAEREACTANRRASLARGLIRRKSTPSGQHYSRAPTPADKALAQRILGEPDERLR